MIAPVGADSPVTLGDAIFLFATENGTIAGWNLADGTTATPPIDNSAMGAVYKGLALANDGTGDRLWVTYAEPDKAHTDEVNGRGHGFVDIYSPTGTLLSHFIAGGHLDSPWGIALAPANFGPLSSLWLIGNFGDGTTTRPITELLFTAGGAKQNVGTLGRIDLVTPPDPPAASPTPTMISQY